MMRMNPNTETQWEQHTPYTVMLRQYREAADKLVHRLEQLKGELRNMQRNKRGTLESAQAQKQLEQRILMLRTEYADITDTIGEIRYYAAREVQ